MQRSPQIWFWMIAFSTQGMTSWSISSKVVAVSKPRTRVALLVENHADGDVSWVPALDRWAASGLAASAPDTDRVTSFVYDGLSNTG
jgi:hypothetical protein